MGSDDIVDRLGNLTILEVLELTKLLGRMWEVEVPTKFVPVGPGTGWVLLPKGANSTLPKSQSQ